MDFFAQFPDHRLLFSAHRGLRSQRPENTCSAFQAALGQCDFIETDIQFSRDGHPVILHDYELTRTSDIAEHTPLAGRSPWRVDAFDLRELRQLDFGSWFRRDDPFGSVRDGLVDGALLRRLPPQRILTLDELLVWVDRHALPVNLEIKDQAGTPHDATASAAVVGAVRRAGLASRVLISSINHRYLRQVAEQAPEIATAALQLEPPSAGFGDYLRQLGVCACHPVDRIIDTALVAELTAAGFTVLVFTVNEPERQRALWSMGVRGVFSDYPPPPA